MANVEKDAITGTDTTGHEWDGIKELDTPLPKWWLYLFYICIAFAVVWWVLFPSWPTLNNYWGGVMGSSTRAEFDADMAELTASRAADVDKIKASSIEEIAADPQMRAFATAGGKFLFAENCAPCHGAGGAGTPGYPTLADDDWLWGGTLKDIQQTVMYGIRSGHADARDNAMPAFGDGILERDDIRKVADYVLSLSGNGEASDDGEEIFNEQCVSCHGKGGVGSQEMGAPKLNDAVSLYGTSAADRKAVLSQIFAPRHGVMPAWTGRLSDAEIKQVTMYVHDLGGGK